MRELLRSKARAVMTAKGYTRINKPKYGIDLKTGQPVKIPSIFSQRWREFC